MKIISQKHFFCKVTFPASTRRGEGHPEGLGKTVVASKATATWASTFLSARMRPRKP